MTKIIFCIQFRFVFYYPLLDMPLDGMYDVYCGEKFMNVHLV